METFNSRGSQNNAEFSSRFNKYYKPLKILGYDGSLCFFEAEKFLFNEFKYKERCAVQRIPFRRNTIKFIHNWEDTSRKGTRVQYTDAWIERPPLGWQRIADDQMMLNMDYNRDSSSCACGYESAMHYCARLKLEDASRLYLYEDDCAFIYIEMTICAAADVIWQSQHKLQTFAYHSYLNSPTIDFVMHGVQFLNERRDVRGTDDFIDCRATTNKCKGSTITRIEELVPEETEVPFKSEFLQNFNPVKIIGQGGYGCVFEVQRHYGSGVGVKRAIKRIPLNEKDLKKVLREVEALVSFQHVGIIRVYEAWTETPPPGWQNRSDEIMLKKLNSSETFSYSPDSAFLYIHMEHCERTLEDWLAREFRRGAKDGLLRWFRELVLAVAHIHRHDRIHRDLKPSNILVGRFDQLKICDFGIVANRASENIGGGEEIDLSRTFYKGTKQYMAPEQKGWKRYNSKVDIFALGLILTELCVKMTRAEAAAVFDDYRDGRDSTILDKCPREKDFVKWLTNVKDSERPNCDEILDRGNLLFQEEWFPYITREGKRIIYHAL